MCNYFRDICKFIINEMKQLDTINVRSFNLHLHISKIDISKDLLCNSFVDIRKYESNVKTVYHIVTTHIKLIYGLSDRVP